MLSIRPSMLIPSTNLMSSKVKFKWTKIEQYGFKEIKLIVAHDTLLSYPDSNEEFKIHNDASDLRLGEVIIQKGGPIAFYSRKLTDANKMYTVTENCLLSIIETLNECRTILLGQRLRIYTDHKNKFHVKPFILIEC